MPLKVHIKLFTFLILVWICHGVLNLLVNVLRKEKLKFYVVSMNFSICLYIGQCQF